MWDRRLLYTMTETAEKGEENDFGKRSAGEAREHREVLSENLLERSRTVLSSDQYLRF